MTLKKGLIGGAVIYAVVLILLGVLLGSDGANDTFSPAEEFRLETYVDLGPFSLNKAVGYLLVAGMLTVGTMLFVANRMQARPNKVQTAVEFIYGFMRDNIARGGMEEDMARKWFPFVGALFLFIWFSNLIGYIPFPHNTLHPIEVFGLELPAFAIYAATANISVPLMLAVIVFSSYTVAGIRAKGPIGYLKSLVPAGVTGGMAVFVFVLELTSNIMRLLSLSVRLFANLLAGHLIILFMAGGMAVLLGTPAVGWALVPVGIILFLFEVGLIATLQAFIFATLSAIYLGGAVAAEH